MIMTMKTSHTTDLTLGLGLLLVSLILHICKVLLILLKIGQRKTSYGDTDDKFWTKYFQRYAASFVPTGVKQISKFFDDDFKKITREFGRNIIKKCK